MDLNVSKSLSGHRVYVPNSKVASMDHERDNRGRYTEQVSLDDVLATFETVEIPVLTAKEVAEELGCSRPSAYNKLEKLVQRGELQKKKVGARAVVYLRQND